MKSNKKAIHVFFSVFTKCPKKKQKKHHRNSDDENLEFAEGILETLFTLAVTANLIILNIVTLLRDNCKTTLCQKSSPLRVTSFVENVAMR